MVTRVAVERRKRRRRQRIDLRLQSMKDFAEFINPRSGHFDHRNGLLSAVVDPGDEVFLKLAERCDDLPVALNLGFQNPAMSQQMFSSVIKNAQ
jgi:hypothetical protein